VRCPRPGCAGTIDDTGFCDTCFRALPPTPTPTPSPVADPAPEPVAAPESAETFDVAGLVPLPVLITPDPTSRLMDGTELLTSRRRCGRNGCTGEIGGNYAGQEAVLEGVCDECGHPYSLKPRLKSGDLVAGQYDVVGPLAQSGFGWVYLARDRHLDDNYVVLKGLINANDSRAAEMAVRERQFLTRLNHPNIVRIYNAVTHHDEGTRETTGYIVMEYVDGPSLDDLRRDARLHEDARLPLEHLLGMGHEILAALGYLHGQGLLYCDMKPSNVMRGSNRITVIDLGGMTEIAAADRSTVGTVPYQAPKEELRTRGATVKSDVHTVGRTLEKMYADAGRGAGVPTVAAESFDRLIRRAVDPDHPHRFASATEMSEQLLGVLRELLSLRDGTEHAAASMLFAPTVEVIDGGLGTVPPLERWTARGLPPPVAAPPPGRSVALGLPIPRTDPHDPGARFLGGGARHDPRDLIARLRDGGEHSAELWLRGCRAHLELGDTEPAERCLTAAEKILRDTPGAWRLEWYGGLLAFARDDVDAAAGLFAAVRDFWPGEAAPKLALGLCAERTGGAEELFRAVWARDRSYTSAAFGLARLRLRAGDRAGAAGILDEVPLVSPHRDAARIAAVRAYAEPLPAAPAADDVAEAERRLPALRLGGGAADGETRRRLVALLRESSPGTDPARLELSYRELATQARTARDHEILVDLANRVRPRTLLTWWR